VNTRGDDFGRQRRRKHSAEFKAKVVAACRKPGVLADEQAPATKPLKAINVAPARSLVENRTFIPIQVESSVKTSQQITIELRRGATVTVGEDECEDESVKMSVGEDECEDECEDELTSLGSAAKLAAPPCPCTAEPSTWEPP
jgi:hypothetical protein